MSDILWEVYALKYAERNKRTRNDSFLFDPHHDSQHDMDYFIWVLKSDDRIILVDTGYDAQEANRRNRPILCAPAQALQALGLSADEITDIIITHLHYDHAGCLEDFPNAKIYLQPEEMAYATGPCMCEDVLRMPYTGGHICAAVTALYSGRLHYCHDDEAIAPGISVHLVGGHARGLQVVRVKTAAGWLVLASDATHYYENFLGRKPFPIVVDMEAMMTGFTIIQNLASTPELVIPGHDPLISQLYAPFGTSGFIWRLDKGAQKKLPQF